MEAPNAPQLQELIDLLRSMSTHVRAGTALPRADIEQALERGFAALVQLEARLQGVQRAGRSSAEESAQAEIEALIETLRDALTELQTLSNPDVSPEVTYGFVLPGKPKPEEPTDPASSHSSKAPPKKPDPPD